MEGYHQTGLISGIGVVTQANQTVTVTQTNTFTGVPTKLVTGQKQWTLPEGETIRLPESITLQLKNGDIVVASQEVTGPDWRYEFNVPKYDEAGNEIDYHIEELPVAHFKPVYDDESLNVTNVYVKPVTSRPLTVEKRLLGDEPLTPETFEFRLSPSQQVLEIVGAGQGTFEPVSFTEAGTFSYTITERNKGTLGYRYDESTYTWTIVVKEVDNQLVIDSETVTKNDVTYNEDTIVFSNRFDKTAIVDEKITINGSKTWQHGNQSVAKRPTSITVLLQADGRVVYQQEVNANTDWAYGFTVNKYDKEGREIVYTVDEVEVPDYQTTVKGFDITNTYAPKPTDPGKDKPDDDGKGKPTKPSQKLPQSGERHMMLLVVIGGMLILVSFILSKVVLKKRH